MCSTNPARKMLSIVTLLAIMLVLTGTTMQASKLSAPLKDGEIVGIPVTGAMGVSETTAEIMERQRAWEAQGGKRSAPLLRPEMPYPTRILLPSAPGAVEAAQWPLPTGAPASPAAPQTIGVNVNGATGPTETGAFPPDTMGAPGPSQFVVFLNGRVRTLVKSTGAADGVINADSDVFFASVMTPPPSGYVSFTTDPMVRFDRLSQRWFLTIIDFTMRSTTGAVLDDNRYLIAVSDAASAGIITGSTVWTFYYFANSSGAAPARSPACFLDYPSLGIDNNALYMGGNMFCSGATSYAGTDGFVIRKASVLSGGPIVVTAFRGMVATGSAAGPFAPRGVDNDDPAATEGYFIGVDNAAFNLLMLRRVSTPGGTPTLSANISIATPLTTRYPVLVPHLGNTGGNNGRLDGLDDRLYAAMMKGGRLWTAHNIGVNNTGVAGASNNRNAVRWYELQNVVSPGTPSVLQSGTLFDPSLPNDANQINMWIPGIAASGQGHAAVGYSRAGTNARIDAVTAGRLSGDTLGTMRTPITFTTSSTAYNPPSDTGSANGSRRWGDYSITSVDPNDNMTMWTIQEYCNGTNTYGVRIAQLIAPPPATPISASPSTVPNNQTSVNVIITGSSVGGSGFYDPGVGFTRRISATVAGGVIVNSVTYTDPTHVTLNLKTTAATPNGGVPRMVRIINPDGQFAEAAILALTTPTALEVGLASIEPAGTTSWILLGGVVMLAVGALVLLTRARRRTGA